MPRVYLHHKPDTSTVFACVDPVKGWHRAEIGDLVMPPGDNFVVPLALLRAIRRPMLSCTARLPMRLDDDLIEPLMGKATVVISSSHWKSSSIDLDTDDKNLVCFALSRSQDKCFNMPVDWEQSVRELGREEALLALRKRIVSSGGWSAARLSGCTLWCDKCTSSHKCHGESYLAQWDAEFEKDPIQTCGLGALAYKGTVMAVILKGPYAVETLESYMDEHASPSIPAELRECAQLEERTSALFRERVRRKRRNRHHWSRGPLSKKAEQELEREAVMRFRRPRHGNMGMSANMQAAKYEMDMHYSKVDSRIPVVESNTCMFP